MSGEGMRQSVERLAASSAEAGGRTPPVASLHLLRLVRDPEAAEAITLAAKMAGVAVRQMLARARGSADVAAARHVAMYLLHVSIGRPQDVVALFFRRHPSTVSHACHAVEDRRDDPQFEAAIAALEERLASSGVEGLRHVG